MSTEKKSMPPVLKAVIIIGSMVLATGLVLGVRHYIKKYRGLKGDRQTTDDTKSALNALANNGIKPSYGPSQYDTWANNIKTAMDGCGDGWANTQTIWKSMRNDADIHALIDAYGNKTVDKCGLGTGDFSGNLSSTLTYKYSGWEGANFPGSIALINKIFALNGLTFQF